MHAALYKFLRVVRRQHDEEKHYTENSYLRGAFRKANEEINKMVMTHTAPDKRVLKANCPSDEDAITMAKKGYHVAAVGPSVLRFRDGTREEIIVTADNGEHTSAYLVYGDLSWRTPSKNSYDVVCALPRDERTPMKSEELAKVIDSAKEGGMICIALQKNRETEKRLANIFNIVEKVESGNKAYPYTIVRGYKL
jgi:hypothetical protein